MVSTCRISVSVALEAPITARRHLLCITAYFFYYPIFSHLCSLLKSTRQTMLKWWPDVFNIFTPETPFYDSFTTSRQASTQFVAKRKSSVMISSFLSLSWWTLFHFSFILEDFSSLRAEETLCWKRVDQNKSVRCGCDQSDLWTREVIFKSLWVYLDLHLYVHQFFFADIFGVKSCNVRNPGKLTRSVSNVFKHLYSCAQHGQRSFNVRGDDCKPWADPRINNSKPHCLGIKKSATRRRQNLGKSRSSKKISNTKSLQRERSWQSGRDVH